MRRTTKLLALLTLAILAVNVSAFGQRKSPRFDPDGTFWIVGDTPSNFSEFSAINLNAKRSRYLPSPGLQITDGKTFRFKTLTVKRDNFTFTTVTVRGVSYSFSGKFLKGGIFYTSGLDDTIPVLEGTLTKFRDGQKIAEANLKLSYFGGT
jgi:hypothetical protein